MPKYEPAIIHQHAQDLYDKADGLVWQAALGSGVTGAAIGGVIVIVLNITKTNLMPPLFIVAALAVAGGAIAAAAAQLEASKLRLQAQQVLCQLMIERNTAQMVQHLEQIRIQGTRGGTPTTALRPF